MDFEKTGYVYCKQLIDRATIRAVRAELVEIMRPFCDDRVSGPDDLDEAFRQVTRAGGALRGNVLKMCSRLASLPLLLADPGVKAQVAALGIRAPAIQAYSILCMEPYEEKFLFEPHQDLKQRTSMKSLAFWIPLSAGPGIGGLGFYPGSQARGPQKHTLSPAGHLMLPPECYADFPPHEFTQYEEGDCLIMSPFLVHWSIVNEGEVMRWTVSLKVDEAAEALHLPHSIHPFVIEDYIDTRSNEERLAAARKRG